MPLPPSDRISSSASSGSGPASPESAARPDWFQEAFDADYLARYAHRNADEARRAVALVLRDASPPTGGTAFDLCCGAGRHLQALRAVRPDLELLGGDLSAPLLAAARPGLPTATLVRLDMRHVPLASGSVDLVTNFFTAFGYFEEDAENFSVFREVARVLRPGGAFAFDFLNAHAARRALAEASDRAEPDASGEVWRVRRSLSPDGRRALKFQERQRDGRVLRESVRLFDETEIEGALRDAGLTTTARYGDYDGGAFERSTSPRLVVLARG